MTCGHTFSVEPQFFQKFRHIGRRGSLAAVAACEGQIGFKHTRHLVDVLLHRVDFREVIDQGKFKLEAREDGAQVVRHSGKHCCALFHRPLDACLHLDEGSGRAAHLSRPARAEVRHFTAFTEALGGIGHPQDRLDLIAQENDRHNQQHR